jgi:CheY-like chemotaxis protein
VVLEAGGPEEALRLADAYGTAIDLLLSDVVMPGMNGIQLAARLKAHRPTLPVLFMSGYSDPALVQRQITDTTPVIDKPFTPAELSRALPRALDGKLQARSSPSATLDPTGVRGPRGPVGCSPPLPTRGDDGSMATCLTSRTPASRIASSVKSVDMVASLTTMSGPSGPPSWYSITPRP